MGVALLLVVVGLALLATAPDRFVLGAATIADRAGLSPIVVGAVVIGVGTSAPEAFVSGLAAGRGEPEVGIGNIIGSNIANLTLVLGVAGVVVPLAVPRGVLRRELPLTVAATLVFAALVSRGLSRPEGFMLLAALVVALVVLVRGSRNLRPADDELVSEAGEFLEEGRTRPAWRTAIDLALGLVGTVAGAQLLVVGAIDIADELGISGGFVGLTLVAVGTSLPELVTAVAAARRGEDQLIIGNLLGSNLFNSLAVGAVVGLVGAGSVTDPTLTVTAVVVMLITTAAGLAAASIGGVVRRWEAAALLALWAVSIPLVAS